MLDVFFLSYIEPYADENFEKLLENWYVETGCPMLLNTSLNIKGMPMVNTAKDAHDFYVKYNVPVLS